jgi:hypothetical protein
MLTDRDLPLPHDVMLELLRRADALAIAAQEAIANDDDEQLALLLTERAAVVEVAIATWRDVATARQPREVLARVQQATRVTLTLGQKSHDAAIRGRDVAAAEIAALEARQQASHDYLRTDPYLRTIDLVR